MEASGTDDRTEPEDTVCFYAMFQRTGCPNNSCKRQHEGPLVDDFDKDAFLKAQGVT
jgi:hypothetical protein